MRGRPVSNPVAAVMEDSQVTVSPRSRGSKWKQPRKPKGKESKGSVRVTCPWPAAMPVGGCPFKNPGVGQALHTVSVLAAASSVLLATFRKAGVVDCPAGSSPEADWTGEKEVSPSKCGCSGIPRWDAIWKGLGWWLRQFPTLTRSASQSDGRSAGLRLCDWECAWGAEVHIPARRVRADACGSPQPFSAKY